MTLFCAGPALRVCFDICTAVCTQLTVVECVHHRFKLSLAFLSFDIGPMQCEKSHSRRKTHSSSLIFVDQRNRRNIFPTNMNSFNFNDSIPSSSARERFTFVANAQHPADNVPSASLFDHQGRIEKLGEIIDEMILKNVRLSRQTMIPIYKG